MYVFSLLLPTSSNIFRWLYPQVVPAPQGTWPLGPSQALIVTRTCTDGTFANDVALGCAGSSHGARCPWGKYEKLTAGMIDQSSTVEIILFQTNTRKMGLEDDVLIGQFYFGLSRVDSRIQHRQIPNVVCFLPNPFACFQEAQKSCV